MLTLEAKIREADTSADVLRKRGFVPAVVYGAKEAARSLSIDAGKLADAWKEAGRTSLVRLTGIGDEKDTLIKEVQTHPVTGRIVHVDFYALEKGKKVQLNVPLEFTGEAPAEKAGHILVKALHEIEVEVAPHELPHSLSVDLRLLKEVGDHILASQIPLPRSATLMTNGDDIVVSVTAFVEEKEPEMAPIVPEATATTEPAPEAGEQPATQ